MIDPARVWQTYVEDQSSILETNNDFLVALEGLEC